MNFYKHHIGDYAQATAHLSFVEDAAYSRIIRKYYAEEKPLPLEVKAVQRLIGARTKEEKQAVEDVLQEFFTQESDGWHNKRCDAEIDANRELDADREAKNANEKERQRRHREERAKLFEALRGLNIVPAYDTKTETLRSLLSNASVTPPVTRDDIGMSQLVTPPVTRNATANQTPDSRLQTPDLKATLQPASTTSTGVAPPDPQQARASPSQAAMLSKALRAEGIDSQPADPRLIAMAEQGVTAETLQAAAAEAKRAKPGERIPVGYVIGIVERWAKDAAAVATSGAMKPGPKINGRQAAISNYAAQAAAARGESNERAASSERDITGESVRIA